MNAIAKDLFSKHFQGESVLRIRVKGVEYMNDDPEEVDVLYAKVELVDGGDGGGKSNPLQLFMDELVTTLISEGYLKQEFDRVKLHATIINSLFRDNRDDRKRDSPASKGGNRRRERVTFDAREILDKFCDFHFADIDIRGLDVSVRKQFDGEGRYKSA